jgi:hypothetical protein
MREEVDRSRENLKNFSGSCGIRTSKVISPGKALLDELLLEDGEDQGVLAADPVHPTAKAYDIIAEAVLKFAGEIQVGNNKRRLGAAEPAPKRAKFTWGNQGRQRGHAGPPRARGARVRGWRGGRFRSGYTRLGRGSY